VKKSTVAVILRACDFFRYFPQVFYTQRELSAGELVDICYDAFMDNVINKDDAQL
jgi:hypothetical protein